MIEVKERLFRKIDFYIKASMSIRSGEPAMIAGELPELNLIDEYCRQTKGLIHYPMNLDAAKVNSIKYTREQEYKWRKVEDYNVIFFSGFEALKPLKGKKYAHNFFHAVIYFCQTHLNQSQTVFFLSSDHTIRKLVSFDDWTSGRFHDFRDPRNETDD